MQVSLDIATTTFEFGEHPHMLAAGVTGAANGVADAGAKYTWEANLVPAFCFYGFELIKFL